MWKFILWVTSTLSWTDIISNFIGAFFGFLFAILVEIWVSGRAEKDTQKKVRENIKDELVKIGKGLEKFHKENNDPLYFRYHTIVWETCINSGYLFSVSGKPIYNQYIDIYTKIDFANDIEKQYFDLNLQREMSQGSKLIDKVLIELDKTRVKRRKEILDEILRISDINM